MALSTDVLKTAVRMEGAETYIGQLRGIGTQSGRTAEQQRRLNEMYRRGSLLFAGMATAGLGLTTQFVRMAGAMETSQVAFTTLLKSSEKARQFVAELQHFAATTPFEFMGLQENAKRMLAFGFAAEQVIPMLTTIGDAIGAMGSGGEGLNRVIRAFGQIRAAGRLKAQELMQLTEAGIPAFQILQEELGLTAAEVTNIGNQGVSADKAIQGMLRGMEKRFGGGMEDQAKTLSGQLSNLKDQIDIASAVLGKEFIQSVKGATQGMTDLVANVADAPPHIRQFITSAVKVGVIGGVIGAVQLRWYAFRMELKAHQVQAGVNTAATGRQTMALRAETAAVHEAVAAYNAKAGAMARAGMAVAGARGPIAGGGMGLGRGGFGTLPGGWGMGQQLVGFTMAADAAMKLADAEATAADKVQQGGRAAGYLAGAFNPLILAATLLADVIGAVVTARSEARAQAATKESTRPLWTKKRPTEEYIRGQYVEGVISDEARKKIELLDKMIENRKRSLRRHPSTRGAGVDQDWIDELKAARERTFAKAEREAPKTYPAFRAGVLRQWEKTYGPQSQMGRAATGVAAEEERLGAVTTAGTGAAVMRGQLQQQQAETRTRQVAFDLLKDQNRESADYIRNAGQLAQSGRRVAASLREEAKGYESLAAKQREQANLEKDSAKQAALVGQAAQSEAMAVSRRADATRLATEHNRQLATAQKRIAEEETRAREKAEREAQAAAREDERRRKEAARAEKEQARAQEEARRRHVQTVRAWARNIEAAYGKQSEQARAAQAVLADMYTEQSALAEQQGDMARAYDMGTAAIEAHAAAQRDLLAVMKEQLGIGDAYASYLDAIGRKEEADAYRRGRLARLQAEQAREFFGRGELQAGWQAAAAAETLARAGMKGKGGAGMIGGGDGMAFAGRALTGAVSDEALLRQQLQGPIPREAIERAGKQPVVIHNHVEVRDEEGNLRRITKHVQADTDMRDYYGVFTQ